MDSGGIDPCFTTFGEFFIVLAQPAIASQPAEGPLDDPPSRMDNESAVVGWFAHDHEPPAVFGADPLHQPARISASRPDLFQARANWRGDVAHILRAVPVLEIRWQDNDPEDERFDIDEQVPFPPLYLLATVVPAHAPLSVVLTDWLSSTAALGSGSRPICGRTRRRRASVTRSQVPSSWNRVKHQ